MRVKLAACLSLSMLLLFSTGCHHAISFQDIAYTIQTERRDKSLTVVIDSGTLGQTVAIRSFMTGIAHSWDAKPGIMLKQIADVEFPQMFETYRVAASQNEPSDEDEHITLVLTVPQYEFSNFRAQVTVKAAAYGADKSLLFEKTYAEQGISKGGKMFGAGAFGMKSAVRQSSFDAYKKIFAVLRSDLAETP